MPYRIHRRWSARSKSLMGAVRRRRGKPASHRYKKRTFRSSRTKTSNVKLGKSTGHVSLRKRVARLEISAKKHYDYVLSRPNGVPIAPYGADNGGTTNESFSQMLAIQPRNSDATIPPVSGSARGTERNTREGMEIFCTKVRLRGRVLGIRVNNTDETKNCSHTIVDASTAIVTQNTPSDRASSIRQACQSRCFLFVLSDNRPSAIDPVTGTYEPNPLPNRPQNPLQGLYQPEGLSTNNTLELLGCDSALRNYTNNRFSVVHYSVLQFDFLHPSRWFNIDIAVNKKLIFKPVNPLSVPQSNSDPVNYNLLFYVSVVPAEVNLIQSPQFIMNDVTTLPPTPVNLLLQPNLQMLSSRTYFRET